MAVGGELFNGHSVGGAALVLLCVFLVVRFFALLLFIRIMNRLAQTHKLLLTQGGSSVFEWHKLFFKGREQAENEQRSGHASMAKSHDNLPSHVPLLDFVTKHGITKLLQPPHSPDVTFSDILLFLRRKRVMKGWYHGTVESIQGAVTRELKSEHSGFCIAGSLQ
uniref:Histone-lysine N-methyltransferase SETMAR-like protein n=1 Tax=Rhipicephalus appendiculatus TaxID=34631 RepID=A0A131YTH7_RHIAP